MTVRTAAPGEAGPPITCPVTGRTWPRAHQIDLKTCASCGGWIDTRHEAWSDPPRRHAPTCPPPVTAPGTAAPAQQQLTVLAYDPAPRPRDETHAAALARLQAEQETTP